MKHLERIGEWMGMDSGRKFWPLDPRASEVSIKDIAHALSRICRFGGRCERFYSVAQHSVLVANLVKRAHPWLAMHALLHDAAEAYLGDVIRPLKVSLWVIRGGAIESFETTEARVHASILDAFELRDICDDERAVIKRADDKALATEARDLMGNPGWPDLPMPDPAIVEPVPPVAATEMFMKRFEQLSASSGPSYVMSGRRGGMPQDPRETD